MKLWVFSPRAVSAVLSAACLCLLLTGCGKRETLVERGDKTQVLHRALDSDVPDLDPHVVTGIAEAKVFCALLEPLIVIDATTLRPSPALAERWEVSPDGLVYTFHIRTDARWSNNEPITAQDCIDSWRRILTPTLAADYAYQFYCIKGAEAFNKGTGDFSGVGLAALDPHTFRVTLARPTPYFLGLLDSTAWSPINVRSIAAIGDPYQRGGQWTRPGKMVTSGPFILKDWSLGQRIVVEKSPTYWDRGHVRLNAIHFYPIDSTESQERAFRAGQLHATDSLLADKVTSYRRANSPALRTDPYLNTYFFRFNVRRAPFNDARIRRALSLALDRQALTAKVLQAGQQPAAALVPPTMPDYTPPIRPLTDLAAARRLLAEAGFPDGKGLPPIEVLVPTKGSGPIVGETIQEFWRRDLGLDVRVLKQEQKVIYAERRAGNYHVLLSDWLGDYFDPTTFLDIWTSDSGNNHTGWKDPAYDALLAEAARTTDVRARFVILQKAESLLLDAAPIAPLYYNTHVYLLQPSVKGWQPTPLDRIDYKHVWLEP
jgi:oligopeptide transport system substrate-binding protein